MRPSVRHVPIQFRPLCFLLYPVASFVVYITELRYVGGPEVYAFYKLRAMLMSTREDTGFHLLTNNGARMIGYIEACIWVM